MWLKHIELNEHEQKLVDMSDEEFDNYMMSNYVDMFKNRKIQEGQKLIMPMNFGFEIGPGWRHVLDSLCKKLKEITEQNGYVCVFDQIKEKFGGARFYYHIEPPDSEIDQEKGKTICNIMNDLVNLHEEYCDHICDVMGTNIYPEDKIKIGGWYYGCGIEGFKKIAQERWGEYAEERVKKAEQSFERTKKLKEIKRALSNLNNEQLETLENNIKENQENQENKK